MYNPHSIVSRMLLKWDVVMTIVLCSIVTGVMGLPLRENSIDMMDERGTGNVHFYLYTNANRDTPQELFTGDIDGVKHSNFRKTRPTKIIAHGWGGSLSSSLNPTIKDAYLDQGDYNIICVDWNTYAKLNYVSARNKVPIVGEDIAEFVDFLHHIFNLDLNDLVVIGHSLGAHVAGYTGKFVKSGKLAAIVGLDPAFPLYVYDDTATRLAPSDAKYVETIQTNGNVKGFLAPIGTASFYPNWGRKQPGCGVDVGGSCSHGRCVKYYVEALRDYAYDPIRKCKDFLFVKDQDVSGCTELQSHIRMGDPLLTAREPGIFYLETNDDSPFGHLSGRHE